MTSILTEPSKSSRDYIRKVASTADELRRALKAKGIRMRRPHSKAFEAGARARIAKRGDGAEV